MFKAYCEKQSILYVSKKCSVSPRTVRKYRKVHEWDKRLAEIQKKAQEKTDDNLARALAQNIKYVQYAKGKVMELMQSGMVVSSNPVADLDKMIRLELLLRGEADSRTENVNTELQNMSTEELLKLKEKIQNNAYFARNKQGD